MELLKNGLDYRNEGLSRIIRFTFSFNTLSIILVI